MLDGKHSVFGFAKIAVGTDIGAAPGWVQDPDVWHSKRSVVIYSILHAAERVIF
jgi:hypothetical protein